MDRAPTTTCYRHTDRRAGVRCQRCERPICPSCMVQASVGFHCPECARRGQQQVHSAGAVLRRANDPLATKVLLGINVALYVLMVSTGGGGAGLGGSPGGTFYTELVVLGGWGPPGVSDATIGVAAGEWWRLLTGAFLHANLLHLGFNMFLLWILGSQIEVTLGRAAFLVAYFTSLFGGSLGVMLLDPSRPTVGASGAVFGLIGLAVLLQRSRGIDPWRSGIGVLLVLNLVITFAVPGISVGGHLGGLLGGLAIGAVVLRFERQRASAVPVVAAGVALSVAVIVASVWAAGHWADPVLGALAL